MPGPWYPVHVEAGERETLHQCRGHASCLPQAARRPRSESLRTGGEEREMSSRAWPPCFHGRHVPEVSPHVLWADGGFWGSSSPARPAAPVVSPGTFPRAPPQQASYTHTISRCVSQGLQPKKTRNQMRVKRCWQGEWGGPHCTSGLGRRTGTDCKDRTGQKGRREAWLGAPANL